jgi:predicted component of type VI protein secretion system
VIGGLPLHLTKNGGVVSAKPCAEVLMTENDAIALIDSGFIPMLAYRDQDIVRVGRLQSIGRPSARLAGRLAR